MLQCAGAAGRLLSGLTEGLKVLIFLVLSHMEAAGSKKTSKKFEKGVDKTGKIVYYLYRRLRDTTCREMETDRGVAQSGSARALGAWGRGFESLHPDTRPSLRETWPRGQEA